MYFLSDAAEFGRGKDKVPRKKRNLKGVVGQSIIGAATGASLGSALPILTKRVRAQKLGLIGAVGVGALAGGINKYKENNRYRNEI